MDELKNKIYNLLIILMIIGIIVYLRQPKRDQMETMELNETSIDLNTTVNTSSPVIEVTEPEPEIQEPTWKNTLNRMNWKIRDQFRINNTVVGFTISPDENQRVLSAVTENPNITLEILHGLNGDNNTHYVLHSNKTMQEDLILTVTLEMNRAKNVPNATLQKTIDGVIDDVIEQYPGKNLCVWKTKMFMEEIPIRDISSRQKRIVGAVALEEINVTRILNPGDMWHTWSQIYYLGEWFDYDCTFPEYDKNRFIGFRVDGSALNLSNHIRETIYMTRISESGSTAIYQVRIIFHKIS